MLGPARTGASGSPPSQARTELAVGCRSPSAVRPLAREEGGGKPRWLAAITARPATVSLTCQLSSQ